MRVDEQSEAAIKSCLESLASKSFSSPQGYAFMTKVCISKGLLAYADAFMRAGILKYPDSSQLRVMYEYVSSATSTESRVSKRRRFNKIFCIGLSRTGTRSVTTVLRGLGYSAIHFSNPETSSIIGWHEIEEFEVLADSPISANLESIYYAYPDAGFIYTTRDVSDWSFSMESLFRWCNGFEGLVEFCEKKSVNSNSGTGIARSSHWRFIHRTLYTRHHGWQEAYESYEQRVMKLFRDDSRFLSINICSREISDTDKLKKLCTFLEIEAPIGAFPTIGREFKNNTQELDGIEPESLGFDIPLAEKLWEEFVQKISKSLVTTIGYINEPDQKRSLPIPESAGHHYIFKNVNLASPNLRTLKIDAPYLSIDGSTPGHKSFYVYDRFRNLMKEFSSGDDPFMGDAVDTLVTKRVVFLDDRHSVFNVCHFLLDKLPRISHFNQSKELIYFLISPSPFASFFFELLEIPFVFGLARTGQRVTYRVSELFLTTASFKDYRHPAQNFSSSSLLFFNNILKPSLETKIFNSHLYSIQNRRIYVSRQRGGKRRILNDIEIEHVLRSFGFQTIFLEELAPLEQIQTFWHAEIVVGLHGAGLANALFLRKGATLAEILPPLCATAAYCKLAFALGLKYHAFVGEDPSGIKPDYAQWSYDAATMRQLFRKHDVKIDPVRFRNFVKDLLVQ